MMHEDIQVLTAKENQLLHMLVDAQVLFDEIVEDDPQFAMDTTNFGRNIDYACQALIMRGVRRKYPELRFEDIGKTTKLSQ